MFSHWNYRIVKYTVGNEVVNEEVFEVCEVYYSESGDPDSFIKNKNPLNRDTIEDIHAAYEKVALAFAKPVLLWDGKKLKELGKNNEKSDELQ
ncbi:hypothetical protein Elgi_37830 [Paenibacillus elgii]|uniref:hypothetical protein n=1 Tax=Paenibacillus elgii TaxID=189691 RepID=UPI002D7AE3D4|nr:hypothetical protein Elgi_37830 [Paenibacillus elgii]